MRVPETHFFLDTSQPSGLQTQLREQIVAAILQRRFPPGARLPATRRLAAHLGVARVTVHLAYQALEADGYLSARTRSGVFVSADPPGLLTAPAPARAGAVDWSAHLAEPFEMTAAVRKPADWRSYPYPFIYAQVDEALFPHNEWRDCARRALGRREFAEVASDMQARDDPLLVAHTLSHSLPSRGVEAAHDELLITMGAQHALWLAIQTLARGRGALRVAVEEPCYPEMREMLRCVGAEVAAVPVDAGGMAPERLPDRLDLVCVSPGCQAPTGASMPPERRSALLARAEAEDFLILEDDYDLELRLGAPPLPALKAADAAGRVIHVGSYSKALFPGLRLGYLVAAAPFLAAAHGLRSVAMRHPPGITQRTAAHFLALGHFNAHVARLRKAYAARRDLMTRALASTPFEIAGAAPGGGASFWMRAPPGRDSVELARRARERGVLIEAGDVFFMGGAPTPYFRMAYSAIPTGRIEEGVRRLADSV